MTSVILSAVLLLCVAHGFAQSTTGPCLPANRLDKESICLRHITDLLFDESHFFFGTDLDNTCDISARNNSDDLTCFVDDVGTRRYSLASRLFNNNFRAESIDRFLTVTFSTLAGRYKACGAEGFPFEARSTDVNPDMDVTVPVYVRSSPKFSMRSDKDTYYTIVITDATFSFVHGLTIDYPDSQDKIPFVPPLNYRNMTNTFAFVVYRQPDRDYMLEPRTLGLMKSPGLAKQFRLNDFASDHGLVGPIAINWMGVKSDPWAIQQVADRYGENYCIKYVMDSFAHLDFGRFLDQPVPYLNETIRPFDSTKIDTNFVVSFAVPAFDFTVCCQPYQSDPSNLVLNPITPGGQVTDNELIRKEPTISTQKTAFSPVTDGPTNVNYVVVAVNPDIPDLGSIEAPFLVWLVSKPTEDPLRPGQFKSAPNALFEYQLPAMAPSASPQRIFFLLFEQTPTKTQLDIGFGKDGPANVFGECPPAAANAYLKRCHFNLTRFAVQNNLVLRGVNWVTTKSQAVTRFTAVVKGGQTEAGVCQSQPGYSSSSTCTRPAGRMDDGNAPGKSSAGPVVWNNCSLWLLCAIFWYAVA